VTAHDRELDVVVWGATGFTGRLVAEYLLGRYGAEGELRWALGGRSRSKLEAVQRGLGEAAADLPLLVGDGDDEAFLGELAQRTAVVCTTVGPYARYGSKLVAACAGHGAHYCDLTGEVQWVRRMLEAHQKQAGASGARIVPSCGFDSIPSDLGVFFVQREMRARHGVACARVKFRVAGFAGGMSGGTVASLLNVLAEAGSDPAVRRILADPYALNPEGERHGPDGADRMTPAYDPDFEAWTGPFVMAAINHKVVRRTNALLGYAYGRDFRYDEATLTGSGPLGAARAAALSAGLAGATAAGVIGPLRQVLGRFLPAPGEGPSPEAREAGYFDIRLFGQHPDDPAKNLFARVTGDRDPGYGSTAKMLGEAAVCLAKDDLSVGGGFWTPAAALGEPLLARLQANAGLTFRIEGGPSQTSAA
jgi:short subunit dehydrogenase-like uncharacterized protein